MPLTGMAGEEALELAEEDEEAVEWGFLPGEEDLSLDEPFEVE